MPTLPDIPATFDDWVDLNTVSGIAVGTAMRIQNKSTVWVHIAEQTAKPALDSKAGTLISNMSSAYAFATVLTGAQKIWARSSVETRTAQLSVQEG